MGTSIERASRSKRFGAAKLRDGKLLRGLRESAGLSRRALGYLMWQRLGVRVRSADIAAVEGGRRPIPPVVEWAYRELTKEPR